MPNPQDLFDHLAGGGQMNIWNALFEWHIWNYICVPKYGWPELRIEQCIDTMAWAAAMNLPQGLGNCAVALGLPADEQKSKVGKTLIRKLCVPQKPTKKSSEKWCKDPALLTMLGEYCLQDIAVEEAVAKKLRPLSPHEQQVWVATQKINLRGLPVAVDEIKATSKIVDIEKDRLNAELVELTSRDVTSASQRTSLLEWVNARMEKPLGDLTGDVVDAALAAGGLCDEVTKALHIRRNCCQTSTAKHDTLLETVCDDGTVKGLLVYHGASTGRWASRGGLNAQNLPRPSLKELDIETAHIVLATGDHSLAAMLFGDQVMDAAVSTVRGVIKAPAGHEFIDADWSSVENRIGSWIAGQQDKVDMFASGLDEYKVFASESLYNIPYKEVTKDQRQVSKSAVLGCMFGQGPKGLIEYAKGYGVTLDQQRSEAIVRAYRSEYSKVASLWWSCGDGVIDAVRNPGVVVDLGPYLKASKMGDYLWLKLPSGRVIAWSKPEVGMLDTPWGEKKLGVSVMGVDRFTHKWSRQKLIGSSVYQSGVQGAARDLMADALLRLEAAGYPIVLLVHDEFLALVPEGQGSEKEFIEIMCRAPAWAKGLPLAAEAWRGVRFKK
jgi:DNA polymerase